MYKSKIYRILLQCFSFAALFKWSFFSVLKWKKRTFWNWTALATQLDIQQHIFIEAVYKTVYAPSTYSRTQLLHTFYGYICCWVKAVVLCCVRVSRLCMYVRVSVCKESDCECATVYACEQWSSPLSRFIVLHTKLRACVCVCVTLFLSVGAVRHLHMLLPLFSVVFFLPHFLSMPEISPHTQHIPYICD